MPRGAQVIYPKDLGAILMEADVGPGVRVLEAGVGSGALSMALLRAGAEVVGYELREDFAAAGQHATWTDLLGETAPYRVEIRDVYDGIDDRGLDRVLLDLPEPWRVLGHAAEALRPGGILCAYLPTINQTTELRYAIGRSAVRAGPDPRGAPAHLAHRGPLGASGPSDGGAHRFPHHRRGCLPRGAGGSDGAAGPSTPDGGSALLDEDALAGALLGGLDDGVLEVVGHRGHPGGAARLVLTSEPSFT